MIGRVRQQRSAISSSGMPELYASQRSIVEPISLFRFLTLPSSSFSSS